MSKISDKIRYIGVNDCEKSLFEGIWPLPFGISYNSYIIVDKKIALVDTIDEGFEREYLENIKKEIGSRAIDYLIVNHMEPDHSSLISLMLDIYPGILIVTNSKAVPMLKGYYGLSEDDVLVVRDGDKLNLGTCDLTFHITPMVHWPETMMTWVAAEKTLFSGDAFGTFGALKHGITDSEYQCDCETNEPSDDNTHYCSEGFKNGKADAFGMYQNEMIRYYSNIVGKYGSAVQAALKKTSSLPIERICSTHGPVWEKRIAEVINLYDRLSRYQAENGVCIVYGSMYGNTAEAARDLERELNRLKIPAVLHNLDVENISAALRDVFRFKILAVGSPTYNGAIFPPVEAFIHAVASRMVKDRSFFAFGSYTWASASVRLLNDFAIQHNFKFLHPGIPFPQAYSPEKCDMASIAKIMKAHMM